MAKEQELPGMSKTTEDKTKQVNRIKQAIHDYLTISPKELAIAMRDADAQQFVELSKAIVDAARQSRVLTNSMTSERLVR